MPKPYHVLIPKPPPELLTVVIPVYNEEHGIPQLIERLNEVLAAVPCAWEVVFVNDGSIDRSIVLLSEAAKQDSRFKVIALSRNFGHQIAATAGLDAANGDAVVLMDADLQDPPEAIHAMLARYREGYDVVYAQRMERRGETWFKRASAWAFYRLMRLLVYRDLPVDVGDYRLMSRRCLAALSRMREPHRFLRGMVAWVGFPQTFVPIVRERRVSGQSHYPLHKMLRFAWVAAVSFSPAPLRLSFGVGVLLLAIGLLYTMWAIAQLVLGIPLVRGWTSLIALNTLSSGAIMIFIGVLGEYIAKIYEALKDRPLYVSLHDASQHVRSCPQQPESNLPDA